MKTGETLLHYEVLEKLGEGGMGEVYKARDTKLDRFVALKFLPSKLTATEAEKSRFIQEAKAASALNHPNVCTIYDIHDYNGQLFIVMEYVDGETLRGKHNLSVKQVIDIGAQAAEGLAAAHEKGIVHRDIKPENIMLMKSGVVKVMDFGLAKLNKAEEASRLTKAGTTLGTVGYMSPEQVQGQDVDHRSDIFSLGVVLYELLAGESPFKGVHETAIMYEIVNVDPPPISELKEGFDPQLDELIIECLEKDKNERCQSAKELARDLRKLKRGSTGKRTSRVYDVASQAADVRSRDTSGIVHSGQTKLGDIPVKNLISGMLHNPRVFWYITGGLLVVTLLLAISSIRDKTNIEAQEIKATILPPPRVNYHDDQGSNVCISPNGKYIAFIGLDSAGAIELWLRPTNSLIARPLTVVTDEAYPFWSPDSRYIAYFDKQKLMKISVDAGTSLPICDLISGRGGTWSPNGTIVFAPEPTGGLDEVSSSGGKPVEIIRPDTSIKNQSLRWPYFLPDGEHFLYSTENSTTGSTPSDQIFVSSLRDTKSKSLINASTNCQYANGYLMFVRQSVLLAQKFDLGSLKLSGEPMPLAQNVEYYDTRISATFSASDNGNLIYLEEGKNSQRTVLLDQKGNVVRTLFDKKVENSAKFSPDGSEIAFDSNDPSEKNIDVWTYDLTRNVLTRLTFEPGPDITPVWSPDGKHIAYSAELNGGVYDSYIRNSDGSGDAMLLYKSQSTKVVTNFSSDGKYLLYSVLNYANENSGWDIIALPKDSDNKPINILTTNFNEWMARFSPNMKWIAYQSDESGKYQIYVIPFNGPDEPAKRSGKWQISVDGGQTPKWMDDGKKVCFISPDNKIMAVNINEKGSSLSPDKPAIMFSAGNLNISTLFDIDDSGTKIIAALPNGQAIQSPITLVSNWMQEVEGKQ